MANDLSTLVESKKDNVEGKEAYEKAICQEVLSKLRDPIKEDKEGKPVKVSLATLYQPV